MQDVSATIDRGSFFTLLGPSGSGKTTTLMMVAGFAYPTRGEVFVDGKPVAGLPPQKRELGMVFQSYAVFPHLTVFDNIAFPLQIRRARRAEIRQRVGEALELVRLQGYDRRLPRQLSGGEQQRVALARALAPTPALLLLDEPLSALDARVRQSLRHEIRGLQRRLGVTTIMVTHDQEEALAMADRIVVMNAGRVEQVGEPAEVYRRPQTPFVARFVGQMNFLSAVASNRSGWARVGNVELRHQPGFEAAAGSAVTLAIRPEEIAVGPSASGAVNCLTARIANLQFLGPFTRLALTVEGNGQEALECDVAATAFAALGVGEGALVPIALDAETLRAFQPVGTAS